MIKNTKQPETSKSWDKSYKPNFLVGILLTVLVGIGAGLGAVIFKKLIMITQIFFFDNFGKDYFSLMGDYYFIFLPAIGGLFVGLIIYFGARETKGSGIPAVMYAITMKGGRIRPRVAFIKTIASALCIGSGNSVGREGPIVQIGSALGSTVGQAFNLPTSWIRTLVACGAAAGVSATFNAPLSGALFAYELLMPSFAMIGLSYIIISSVLGNVVAMYFLDNKPIFALEDVTVLTNNYELIIYVILALSTGFIGFGFVKALHYSETFFDNLKKVPEWFKPVFGGLIVGILGIYSIDLLGVGYGEVAWESKMSMDHIFAEEIPFLPLFLILGLKMIATSASMGSGASGGIFAPSLYLGAMTGGIFGYIANYIFPEVHIGSYALVGAGALFAAVARTPITSIVMILELTKDYTHIIPVMLTVIIATETYYYFSYETIFTAKLRRRGVNFLGMGRARLATGIRVGDIMSDIDTKLLKTFKVSDLRKEFNRSNHNGLIVIDEEGKLYGIVTRSDLKRAGQLEFDEKAVISDICTTEIIKAFPDQTISEIINRGYTAKVSRIPIVDPIDEKTLLGIVRRQDFIKAWEIAHSDGEALPNSL